VHKKFARRKMSGSPAPRTQSFQDSPNEEEGVPGLEPDALLRLGEEGAQIVLAIADIKRCKFFNWYQNTYSFNEDVSDRDVLALLGATAVPKGSH